jgi:hypothetical protein
MSKSNAQAFMSFKTMRGALGAAKRALQSGAAFRDAKRRLAARIRVLKGVSREMSKDLAVQLLTGLTTA